MSDPSPTAPEADIAVIGGTGFCELAHCARWG